VSDSRRVTQRVKVRMTSHPAGEGAHRNCNLTTRSQVFEDHPQRFSRAATGMRLLGNANDLRFSLVFLSLSFDRLQNLSSLFVLFL